MHKMHVDSRCTSIIYCRKIHWEENGVCVCVCVGGGGGG